MPRGGWRATRRVSLCLCAVLLAACGAGGSGSKSSEVRVHGAVVAKRIAFYLPCSDLSASANTPPGATFQLIFLDAGGRVIGRVATKPQKPSYSPYSDAGCQEIDRSTYSVSVPKETSYQIQVEGLEGTPRVSLHELVASGYEYDLDVGTCILGETC